LISGKLQKDRMLNVHQTMRVFGVISIALQRISTQRHCVMLDTRKGLSTHWLAPQSDLFFKISPDNPIAIFNR
jgi:hypothetical protein